MACLVVRVGTACLVIIFKSFYTEAVFCMLYGLSWLHLGIGVKVVFRKRHFRGTVPIRLTIQVILDSNFAN